MSYRRLFSALAALLPLAVSAVDRPPNVVVIFIDDKCERRKLAAGSVVTLPGISAVLRRIAGFRRPVCSSRTL
jgi:hypothetical protein